jgi:hypothetical protein
MPLVSKSKLAACRAERLAGARTAPNWAVVRPPNASQGVGPDSDAGEEMALVELGKVVGLYVKD